MHLLKDAPMPTELLTAGQVAAKLRVSVATVNRMARSGRLPVAKKLAGIRGANLFDSATIEQHLAAEDARWAAQECSA